MLTGFLDQQQIYAGHSIRLSAKPVNSHILIPAKYIGGQVILLLHFGDLRDGRELVGYLDDLSIWSQAGIRADRSTHRRQWSFLFFTLTTFFLDLTAAGSGM